MLADRDRIISLLGSGFGQVHLTVQNRRFVQTATTATVEDILFHSNDGTEIPATFLHPPQGTVAAPAVLYCHAHGAAYEIGRSELTDGRPALSRPYLEDLVDLGVAALCLEMPCFGARADLSESATAKSYLWHGDTLFGRMLAELHAGVGFLAEQPQIDENRIGAYGVSMGGTHAWWLAALDPRIKAAVNVACFADLASLVATGAHDGHGNYMTVPGLLAETSTGALAGLAAPRAQLTCVGLQDVFTPKDAFEIARQEVQQAYDVSDAGDMLEFVVDPDVAHVETVTMRGAVLDFLSRRL